MDSPHGLELRRDMQNAKMRLPISSSPFISMSEFSSACDYLASISRRSLEMTMIINALRKVY